MQLDFDFEAYLLDDSSDTDDTKMDEYPRCLDALSCHQEIESVVEDLATAGLSSENNDSDIQFDTDDTPGVVEHIEDMVLNFLKQLAAAGNPNKQHGSGESDATDVPPTRADYKIEIPLVDRRKADVEGISSSRLLRYPKKSPVGSARNFAQLFKVLDLAHEATLSGVPATKRDIYYRDVSLFRRQGVVDSLVDDLAATFEVERSDLNIRSSSKGVVCGSGLTIELCTGEIIQCSDAEATLIPAGEDIQSFSIDDNVAWVLVVEKEAVFQTLCRLQICKNNSLPGSGIIITGKGYPDVATRHLVKSLADALPQRIPIMGLVDSDPYGLDILSVYKYGSQLLQHENAKLAARRIKWLGIWASELESLHIGKDLLLPITVHDERKALSILRRQNVPLPRKWKTELQYMLHTRRKAEIEIISSWQATDTSLSNHDWETTSGVDAPFSNDVHSLPAPNGHASTFPAQTRCNPHALLIQYLISKITAFVLAAADREAEA